jgi:hypothetical protein
MSDQEQQQEPDCSSTAAGTYVHREGTSKQHGHVILIETHGHCTGPVTQHGQVILIETHGHCTGPVTCVHRNKGVP